MANSSISYLQVNTSNLKYITDIWRTDTNVTGYDWKMKYGTQYLGMQYLRVEETYSACDTNYVF